MENFPKSTSSMQNTDNWGRSCNCIVLVTVKKSWFQCKLLAWNAKNRSNQVTANHVAYRYPLWHGNVEMLWSAASSMPVLWSGFWGLS